MNNAVTLCRSCSVNRPICTARQFSSASGSADLESIPPLQGIERSGRLCQFFRPNVPVSTSVALAVKRRFFRIVFEVDRIGVCGTASFNLPAKNRRAILRQMNLRPSPTISFSPRRPVCLTGIAKHIRHAAFEPFQQKFQRFQGDILLAHFHSMK
jgi:hypothetical protein